MKLKCPNCKSSKVELIDDTLVDDVTNLLFAQNSVIILRFACSNCDELFEGTYELTETEVFE